jgi:SAM-dependent methyltransferase
MRYYERREGPQEWDESYWSDKKDPDGVTRNMLMEKDRKVEDLKREIRFINRLDAGNVLDLGCGLGHVMTAIDRKHKVFGFEVSEFAADEARKNNPDAAVFQAPDLANANFADGFFDAILCYHVIEHVDNPYLFLKQVTQLLKKGGHLIIGTPDFKSPTARLYGDKYRMLHDPTHINLFSCAGLGALLTDYDYEIEEVYYPYYDCKRLMEKFRDYASEVQAFANGIRIEGLSPPMPGDIFTIYARRTF